MIEKSANRLWKESGTTLSFKDWLNREKAKFMNFNGVDTPIIPNVPLNDTIQKTIQDIKKDAGYKEKAENKTVLGLNKTVLIVAGIALTAFIVYKIVNKKK